MKLTVNYLNKLTKRTHYLNVRQLQSVTYALYVNKSYTPLLQDCDGFVVCWYCQEKNIILFI